MNTTESDGNFTYNPEYSKRGTKVFSILPNIDSKINYTVQMNNTTGVKYKFDSVTVSNTNSNVECLPSVAENTIIEPGVSSFTIEVKYKDGITMDEKTDICEIKYEFSAYDVTPPTIRIETITDGETSKTVKITAVDDEEGSGLSEENNYKYYLSTSNIELTGGEWKDYTNKEEFTIEGKNQTKYLWIYPVQDKAGNISDDKTGITESYFLQEYNFISTYTVSYIGNKFSTTAKVQNGVTATYDPNTSILTLNGNPTSSSGVDFMYLNQAFNENDQFKITLDYISGTFTSSGGAVIATSVANSNKKSTSIRNYSDTTLPTSGSRSSVLTITSVGANEGAYLYAWLWIASPSTATFTDYKVKVNITKIDTKRVKYNEPYGTLGATPTRYGYDFQGWYTEETGGTKVTSDTIMTTESDHNIYAHWRPATYTLTVNPNGGVLNGTTNNSTYNLASGSTENILNPTRTGYVFAGWTVSGQGSSMSGTTFTMGYENATLTANWASSKPTYTYTGSSQLIDDGNGNWRIKFLTSGTLTFTNLGTGVNGIDVFLVGGGGGGRTGSQSVNGAGGGGGGYTTTKKGHTISAGSSYNIVIGAGGATNSNGGTSSAFGFSAAGGKYGSPGSSNFGVEVAIGGNGGSGGGGGTSYQGYGGNGGSNGSNGSNGTGGNGGKGQGTTTREFGESDGTLYAGGGAGTEGKAGAGGGGVYNNTNNSDNYYVANGTANTGGGGGGGAFNFIKGGTGGSGIVVIRNTRVVPTEQMPSYTYTGTSRLEVDKNGNWKIKFLSSGTLTFTSLGDGTTAVDLFLVGGGGSGRYAGGGGGYTRTVKSLNIALNTSQQIVVGKGAAFSFTETINGGSSSALGYTAAGGYGVGQADKGGNGGSGGGGYAYSDSNSWAGSGGTNGKNGDASSSGCSGGYGQISVPGPNGETGNTREFGESTGDLYSGGGGGTAASGSAGLPGEVTTATNSGRGGGGVAGEDGIVIIRKHQ